MDGTLIEAPYDWQKIRSDLEKGSVIERPIVDPKLRRKLLDKLIVDIDKLSEFSHLSFSEWFKQKK